MCSTVREREVKELFTALYPKNVLPSWTPYINKG